MIQNDSDENNEKRRILDLSSYNLTLTDWQLNPGVSHDLCVAYSGGYRLVFFHVWVICLMTSVSPLDYHPHSGRTGDASRYLSFFSQLVTLHAPYISINTSRKLGVNRFVILLSKHPAPFLKDRYAVLEHLVRFQEANNFEFTVW